MTAVIISLFGVSRTVSAEGFRHVRSADSTIRDLLSRGYERSATFRTLIDRIESLPGIVYIEPAVKLSRGMDGALLHSVSGSPGMPILRVAIRTSLAGDYAISVLAHELQHVVEALSNRDLMNGAAMTAWFQKLNAHDGSTAGMFETDEARAVALQVLNELHNKA